MLEKLRLGVVLAGLLAIFSMPAAIAATTFPDQPIRIIVPRAPGGGSDIIARLIAPGLQEKLGVTIVVDNRPDSTTVRGASTVANSKPDGYTLFLADNSFYQNPALLKELPYDTIKSFSAITMLAEGPVILIAKPNLPANTLQELITLAREKPGAISYASGGVGSSTHLAGVLLSWKTGVQMIHVPYKSSGEALNALLGQQVDTQFGGISSARPMIESGKVKAISLSGAERDPSMPDVPTNTEAGVADADVMSVWGIHAPAGTPLEIREKIRNAIAEVMKQPALQERLSGLGYHVLANTPQAHQKLTEGLVNQWLTLAKEVDLTR